MKKFILLGLLVTVLAGCEDMPFEGMGRDDLTDASHPRHLMATPDQTAQSGRPASANTRY